MMSDVKFNLVEDVLYPHNDGGEIHNIPPAKIYEINFNPLSGIYFKVISDNYTVRATGYGGIKKRIDAYMASHKKNRGSILMEGGAGTGKTIEAMHYSNRMLKAGLPVFEVRKPLNAAGLGALFESIKGFKCVVYIDEFDKLYSNLEGGEDAVILRALNDEEFSNITFIITMNHTVPMVGFISNRPTRMYWNFNAVGNCRAVSREMIEELDLTYGLVDPNDIGEAWRLKAYLSQCYLHHIWNIDMVDTIVEIIKELQTEDKLSLDNLTEAIKWVNISDLKAPKLIGVRPSNLEGSFKIDPIPEMRTEDNIPLLVYGCKIYRPIKDSSESKTVSGTFTVPINIKSLMVKGVFDFNGELDEILATVIFDSTHPDPHILQLDHKMELDDLSVPHVNVNPWRDEPKNPAFHNDGQSTYYHASR